MWFLVSYGGSKRDRIPGLFLRHLACTRLWREP